jgi:hypothetical protein
MEQRLVLFGHLWPPEILIIKQNLAALKDLQVHVPDILSVSEMRTHLSSEDHESAAGCDCEGRLLQFTIAEFPILNLHYRVVWVGV